MKKKTSTQQTAGDKALKESLEQAGGKKKKIDGLKHSLMLGGHKNAESEQKGNLLFEIPSIHKGKVHVVVAPDLLAACALLAETRKAEDVKNHAEQLKKEKSANRKKIDADAAEYLASKAFRRSVSHRLADYVARCYVEQVTGIPSDHDAGIVEINHVTKIVQEEKETDVKLN